MPASPVHKHGLFFVLVGPPGAGKNALMNAALSRLDNISQLATATTRSIRDTEEQGREHLFLSFEEFQTMIDNDELLEWQRVHLNLYGIPKHVIETAFAENRSLTADIDVLGATYIRSLYPDHVILIFIKPPSIDELENRMRQRGETETEVARRMKRVVMEMQYERLCDYVIVNDDFDEAANQLVRIIETERNRTSRPRLDFQHIGEAIGVYGTEVLYRGVPPHFTTCLLKPGEIPHLGALRAFEAETGIARDQYTLLAPAAHQGSFVPPASVHILRERETGQITFRYLLIFQQRPEAPAGWSWVDYHQPDFSADLREALEDLPQFSTGD